MSIFSKMREPVFLKESNSAEKQLEQLRKLEPQLNQEGQALIRQDIKCLEYGIAGEKNLIFELKNSHMPIFILQDIYLEDGDLSAQIDFLIFTKKLCFVVECKNLYGSIEINSAGDFIRTMEFFGKKRKEGIYSPITQNQRHLELMKKIKSDNRKNVLTKHLLERNFDLFFKSVVVLSNPKTVLNAKYAKKEMKEKVIRADQLINYIKETNGRSKEMSSSENEAMKWAESYLNLHKEVQKDYTKKYERYRIQIQKQDLAEPELDDPKTDCKMAESKDECAGEIAVIQELKAYRLQKSSEEGIKPYYIFTDNHLKDLIRKMPESIAELLEVEGFGEKKVSKYGSDIIKILMECR